MGGFVEGVIDSFMDDFESALDYWRRVYKNLDREHRDLCAKLREERASSQDRTRLEAAGSELINMRGGTGDLQPRRFLATVGFLPN